MYCAARFPYGLYIEVPTGDLSIRKIARTVYLFRTVKVCPTTRASHGSRNPRLSLECNNSSSYKALSNPWRSSCACARAMTPAEIETVPHVTLSSATTCMHRGAGEIAGSTGQTVTVPGKKQQAAAGDHHSKIFLLLADVLYWGCILICKKCFWPGTNLGNFMP